MDYQDCGLDGLTFVRPSLVKPQFAADCDLSNIVRRFIRTGELPAMRERRNIETDANYPESYQVLQDTLALCKSRFESLPDAERARYGNDPELWLASHADQLKPTGDKSVGDQSTGEKSVGDQSTGEKSVGDQSSGEKSV